ncbi:MAG: NAD(P)-binding domain-containing protein [Streptosporangiaceae bacterium]|nr:NAD(P)-binding domain-containing protein [Streptosporangiaceae bacterium]
MTTAIIGTGGIGSVIARHLSLGSETLRLSSADKESARTLAAQIGRAAVVAVDNHDAVQGADAVVLALRFTVLKGVIAEIADPLTGRHEQDEQRTVSTRGLARFSPSPDRGYVVLNHYYSRRNHSSHRDARVSDTAQRPYRELRPASSGTSTCALGDPQPVTGSHPGPAWYPVTVTPVGDTNVLLPVVTSWKARW